MMAICIPLQDFVRCSDPFTGIDKDLMTQSELVWTSLGQSGVLGSYRLILTAFAKKQPRLAQTRPHQPDIAGTSRDQSTVARSISEKPRLAETMPDQPREGRGEVSYLFLSLIWGKKIQIMFFIIVHQFFSFFLKKMFILFAWQDHSCFVYFINLLTN